MRQERYEAKEEGKMITEWKKDCKCGINEAGMPIARTRATRFKSKCDGKSLVVTAIYYPGPSCDICGKPWKQIK